MSRSFHQKHPTHHNSKNRIPNPFKDKEGKIWRKRKIKPYGYRGWCGYGGEKYFKRFGELALDIVDKKWARRESKKIINKELENDLKNVEK